MRRSGLWLICLAACPPGPSTLDVVAPSVASTVPADRATGVPLGTIPRVCFGAPMSPTTLTTTTLKLSRKVGSSSKPVAGVTVGVDPDGLCATLYLAGSLSPSSGYGFEVTTGALSAAGVEVAHAKDATNAFTSSFFTAGQPTQANLWVPANGTLSAPLDLAQVQVSFSRPVGGAADPLQLTPTGGPSTLAQDGSSATAPLSQPETADSAVSIALSPALVDPDGNPPVLPGSLGFSYGGCPEGTPPSVSDGTVLPRDRDALLLYQVDRPCLCGAQLSELGCPGAAAVVTPATCQEPYDPCQGGLLCSCQVPLVGLCANGSALATPLATGWNAQVGSGPDACPFQLAEPLPPLAIDELLLSPSGTRAAGEFIEIANLGPVSIDLLGIVLASCTGSVGCAIPKTTQAFGPYVSGGPTAIPPYGYALLVDGRFDPTQAPSLSDETLLLSPLGGAPLLSLSTSKPQPVGLFAAGGAGPPLSTFDGSLTAVKGLSVERLDPGAPDPQPGDWAMSTVPGGTPGSCNSVTPAAECAEAGQ